jgi:hypothetical protein
MKRLFTYIGAAALFISLMPSVAFADLQCYSSVTAYSNVQNANQCFSDNPGAYLLDTSSNSWTDAKGNKVGGFGIQPVDPAIQAAANQVTCDLNGFCVKSGVPVNQITQQPQTPPTYTPTTATASTNTGNGKLTYTPLEPLPGGDSSGSTYNSLSKYFSLMFNIFLSLGAMIAVVSLVFGGITYMISEVVDKKAAARRRITASFIGLGLLLTCWLILNTINPNLVHPCIFNLDAQCGASAGTGGSGTPLSVNSPNPVASPAQLQDLEKQCKAQGPSYAFFPNQDGSVNCYNTQGL